ncbi:MAG: hypothetical protein R6W90_07655 [Ignavibacteriaceae bacterium]
MGIKMRGLRKTSYKSGITNKRLRDKIHTLKLILKEKDDIIDSLAEANDRKNRALEEKEIFPKNNQFKIIRSLIDKGCVINKIDSIHDGRS